MCYDNNISYWENSENAKMIKMQINEFGQVPKQLFFKPHPQKYSFSLRELGANDIVQIKDEEEVQDTNINNTIEDKPITITNVIVNDNNEDKDKISYSENIIEEKSKPKEDYNDIFTYFSSNFKQAYTNKINNIINYGESRLKLDFKNKYEDCSYRHKE